MDDEERKKRILMVIPEIIENDIVGAGPEKCEREIYFFFIIIIIREKRRRQVNRQVSLSLISSGSHYVNTIGLSPMCRISHDPSRPSIHPSIHPNCEKEKKMM
jgi:hypothetical protein